MTLTNDRLKQYRSLAHALHPIVTIAGKGLTETVLTELDRALEDHELIKIKIAIDDRDSRKAAIAEACDKCNATLVQEIGKVAVFFRAAQKPNPRKSNIR